MQIQDDLQMPSVPLAGQHGPQGTWRLAPRYRWDQADTGQMIHCISRGSWLITLDDDLFPSNLYVFNADLLPREKLFRVGCGRRIF